MNRDYFFDNAKFYLITLVFVGHVVERCLSNDLARWLYDFIYIFHMPSFVFISGYFSNKSRNPKRKLQGLFKTYIVFQVIYMMFFKYGFGIENKITFTIPYWVLWFLVSLITWEILSPYFSLNCKSIFLMIGVSLIAGFFEDINGTLSISRTIYYFPFFLWGKTFKREHINIVKKPFIKTILIAVWCFIGIHILKNLSSFDYSWFYGSLGYKFFKLSFLKGVYYRGITYIISALSMLTFLSLVTEKRKFISKLGKNTMPVYILHVFIVKYLELKGFFNNIDITNSTLALMIISTILLTILLSSNLISKPFNFILDINNKVVVLTKRTRVAISSSFYRS